jgi:hypothetical protein
VFNDFFLHVEKCKGKDYEKHIFELMTKNDGKKVSLI